jgi:hypothetical protein
LESTTAAAGTVFEMRLFSPKIVFGAKFAGAKT